MYWTHFRKTTSDWKDILKTAASTKSISRKQQQVLVEFPGNKGMCGKIFPEITSNVRRVSYQQHM